MYFWENVCLLLVCFKWGKLGQELTWGKWASGREWMKIKAIKRVTWTRSLRRWEGVYPRSQVNEFIRGGRHTSSPEGKATQCDLKSVESSVRLSWVGIWGLLYAFQLWSFSKRLNWSVPQFPPQQKRDNALFVELLQGLNKITHVKQEHYNRICWLFL